MSIDQMTGDEFLQLVPPLGVEDEDEKGDNINTALSVSKEMASLAAQVHSSTSPMVSLGEAFVNEAAPVAQKQSTKEFVNSENSSSESVVFDQNELGDSRSEDFQELSLESTLSSQKAHLLKQMFRKYGDITKGSMLKSVEAKTAFLQLVAEVVERLHSHNLDTIDAHEMQLMQKWIDDAASVGFHVVWLQQRIRKVVTVFKYKDSLMQLNEISKSINDAKIALLEMELKEMILKKEIDLMKAEMDRENLEILAPLAGFPLSWTTSTTSAALASAPKLPSEITGRTVEEIIKEWNAELQERTGKFRKQANAIADWDRRILQNRDILLRLETEVAKVVETQGSLERQLELIETHQDEVDKALQSMEEEAERMYREERGLLLDDDAASTRDAMYEQAEVVERELEQMTEQIKSIINTLNANQASAGGELEASDGMTPLDAVVRILNNQLSSLMWVDEKAKEFSSRIQKLATQGSTAQRESTGPKLWLN
ncbi:nuclear pore complex protein nup62 [Phtheirospermum japonicum]|uniref:Nuclear pore complex protein nup62 n=1 Tax=Phtheirospermum japonicum TaxID=374723 RepID=A0A830BFV5_9LAMI|nr:nuclear pore complex protein nup62 [Phtheirospermum japonicum]